MWRQAGVGVALILATACVSDSGPLTKDASDDATLSDAGDAAQEAAVVNGCTTFTDERNASSPTIAGPPSPPAAQYTPSCVHIKAGQSIIFSGDFTNFPLEPSAGSTGNPITAVTSGNIATFGFPSAGTFGFDCSTYPALMRGAVWVTTN